MDRKEVKSSYLKSVGYENGTLEIEFINGAVFEYYSIPASLYAELMQAESPGRFFIDNIKDVSYAFARVS